MMTTKLKYLLDSSNNFKHRSHQFDFLLLVVFVALTGLGMIHHEMWRDELEAWLIARDSTSIAELFSNLTYTGHPFLWYFSLYLLAKVTNNPAVIQVLHLAVVAGALYLFIYFSPFNKLQKTLFCFGYFPLYEYGVISRGYSLGMLFIFLFCVLHCQRKRNYVAMALALALASQTSVYALIISFALALGLFSTDYNSVIRSRQFTTGKKVLWGSAIYLFGLLGAIAQITRASSALSEGELGAAISSTVHRESYSFITIIKNYLNSSLEFEKVFAGIWRSYIPIPMNLSDGLWSTNFLTDNQNFPRLSTINTAPLLAILLSGLLFLLFAHIFSSQKKVLFIYVSGTAAIYLFGFVAKIPSLRHSGHLFVLLIVCYWLFCDIGDRKKGSSKQLSLIYKYHRAIVTLILTVQFYAGTKLYILDLARPFSNIHSVALFIQQNQLEEGLIVGTKDSTVFPLSAWLERKMYYPETKSFETFTVWTPESVYRNSDIAESEIIEQAHQLKRRYDADLILVADRELEQETTEGNLNFTGSFQEPSLIRDRYFIYSVN